MDISHNASGVSFTSLSSLGSGSGCELESELGRGALREICCSVLSRVLDLADSKLETLLGADEKKEESGLNVAKNIAHKLRAFSQRLRTESDEPDCASYPTLTFGAPITADDQAVLLQLVGHMEEFVTEEGLFRKPGSRSRVEQLAQELARTPFHLVACKPTYTAHDYASVLKHYFSELPEPLMLQRNSEAYHQAAELRSDDKRTLCLQLLVLLLPPLHHTALAGLLSLLCIVAQCQESKMDAHNLAVVFAPTLFCNCKTDILDPIIIRRLVSVLEHLIVHAEEIFDIPKEIRVVADRYMRKRVKASVEEDVAVDIYSTSCERKQCSDDEFHKAGQERALEEVAALYELIHKMPDGPKKAHFLKRIEAGSRIPGTPPAFVKSRKFKENSVTPKMKLSEGIGSNEIKTPLRLLFRRKRERSSAHVYATPMKPKASLLSYGRMETNV